MDKKLKRNLAKDDYQDRLYEVAKTILPSIYDKVDRKYMESRSTFIRTCFTALSIAEVFLSELGYYCEDQASEEKSVADSDPIYEMDNDTNLTVLKNGGDLLKKLKEDRK